MAEKLFGDRVVTMSGMKRRQAPGVLAAAATTSPTGSAPLPAGAGSGASRRSRVR
jgi:hypothetical protein